VEDEPMPNDGRVNMGAYGTTVFASRSIGYEISKADSDINGIVDLLDLYEFNCQWLNSGPKWTADINKDNIVDMIDWSYFGNDWLWQAWWHE
jgi:hypothetical protein